MKPFASTKLVGTERQANVSRIYTQARPFRKQTI
jgi:hypothetical protein